MRGKPAFGEDLGTLHAGPNSQPMPLTELLKTTNWQKELKKRIGRRPLVWFVDDEEANRRWFVDNHRFHFALLTFSGRSHVHTALDTEVLCDAVVTDIFFPADIIRDDAQADQLLSIYNDINSCKVSDLPSLWNRWKNKWSLDGFVIA